MIADGITVSRILFSLTLLALSPRSPLFALLYLLCGVTDVLDGFAARKLHTESEEGEMLDSAADLVFAVVCAVKILPLLPLALWVWIWTAVIAAAKVTGIIIAGKRGNRLTIGHSFGNRLTGLLLFLLPFSALITDVKYAAPLVCFAATLTVFKEIKQIQDNAKRKGRP